jgi:hypothetical protein
MKHVAVKMRGPRAAQATRWVIPAVLLLAAGNVAAQDVAISMVVMNAAKEGRKEPYFDRGLEPVREALASLIKEGFDTFRRVKTTKAKAGFGDTTKQAITPNYTLYCTPHSKDNAGRIVLEVRIEKAPEKKEDKPAVVLNTKTHAPPGHHITIPLPKDGEQNLVVVLSIDK